MKVFEKELLRQINTPEFAREISVQMSRNVKGSFNRSKQDLLRIFYAHPVTREILEGVGSENISDTMNGYGDLFSFIGFDKNDNPIELLRGSLLEHTTLSDPDVIFLDSYWQLSYSVTIDLDAIYRDNPMPWAPGLSWPESIESDLINLGFFISRQGIGDSGGGVQAKKLVRSQQFKPTKYLSEVSDIFLAAFNTIKIR